MKILSEIVEPFKDVYELCYHILYTQMFTYIGGNDEICEELQDFIKAVDGGNTSFPRGEFPIVGKWVTLKFAENFRGSTHDIINLTCEIKYCRNMKVTIEAFDLDVDGSLEREVIYVEYIDTTISAFDKMVKDKLFPGIEEEEKERFIIDEKWK